MDLAAYFARIGYSGPKDPTLQTLAGVVTAHTRHLPFENLDPLLGVPVTDLSPAALTDKLVHHRRGGYCYEQNNLMRYALTDLGFEVDPLAGRVVWMDPAGLDGPPHPETHETLAVRIPGDDEGYPGPYLVDVGFGGQTLTSPIRLTAGPVQETRHEPYRLRRHGHGYVLEALLRNVWQPLYTFSVEPRPLIDMQVGSWYVSTYPASIFVVGLSAALVTDDARWNLRGRNLTVHSRDGGTEHVRFDTAAQVLEALTDRFGIDLSGLGDVESRVAEVLDS
ncbi:MAG TPA: arylamine N-acetyltransferase [Mycobacterium sp.]|nr:arylamine N-acetyltransferase [Mycobacterium sp.]